MSERSVPRSLPSHLTPLWEEIVDQCKPDTPDAAIEAMVRQIYLMRDAETRIKEEGAIVVDGKGNATEHPAIKIQRDAGKELRTWLERYGRRVIM